MRKLALCLLLVLALPASAADYYHLRDYVTNTYGSAIPGASVRVYNPNTTTAASDVYTDIGGNTAVTWPLATDSNGMFECYLPHGNYDVYIVHTGHAIDTTWDNYMVGTGSDTTGTGEFTNLEADTLHPNTGVTLYVRAADGQDDAILDVQKVAVDTLRSGTAYVRDTDGSDDAAADAERVESDTLQPRTGVTLYVRAADGQDDAILDVDEITGLSKVTVETLVVSTIIEGGTRHVFGGFYMTTNVGAGAYFVQPYGAAVTPDWSPLANGDHGYAAIRDGSITGIAGQVKLDNYTGTTELHAEALVNGVEVFQASYTSVDTTGGNWHPTWVATQAPGIDTFSAGDVINAHFTVVGGTVDVDYPKTEIELTYSE